MKYVFALLFASVTLAAQVPVVNSPSPDCTIIRIPRTVNEDVMLCVDLAVDSECLRIADVRHFLKTRKLVSTDHVRFPQAH